MDNGANVDIQLFATRLLANFLKFPFAVFTGHKIT